MRLLVIEDNLTMANGLKNTLSQVGYAVDIIHDGRQGYSLLETHDYDLLVLDLGLPSMDGIDLLRRLRNKNKHIPVLVISARDQLDQRIEGLDIGADDYICKPFVLDEITARIRALLRRSTPQLKSTLKLGGISLDTANRRISLNGREITLHRREFCVLEYLLSNIGKVVSKSQIAEHISSFEDDINPVAIETYISRLRKKLDLTSKLKTVRGLGYLLDDSE